MVRGFARDYIRQCGCAQVISYTPNSLTPEQERRRQRSRKEGIKKKNAERDRKIRDFPALVQRGIITPLDTEYQARKQANRRRCAELKKKTQELIEIQKRRRQVLDEQQECVKRARSDEGQKPEEEEANHISETSTQEKQQAETRAAASFLDFDPKEELSSSS